MVCLIWKNCTTKYRSMCNWINYRIQSIGGTSYGVLAFLHQLPHHNSLYQQVATYTHSHVIVHVTWPCPIDVTVLITPTMLAVCVCVSVSVSVSVSVYALVCVPACVLCECVWVLMCLCMSLQVCMGAYMCVSMVSNRIILWYEGIF